MNIRKLAITMVFLTSPALVLAQSSAANAQRCAQLNQEIQKEFQDAVQARVPTKDPSSYVQDSFDIKSILSQDVGASFQKLLNMDFSGIIDKVVTKAIDKGVQKANQQFNSQINGVLNKYGINSVNVGGLTGGLSNSVGNGLSNMVPGMTPRTPATPSPTQPSTPKSPYGRQP